MGQEYVQCFTIESFYLGSIVIFDLSSITIVQFWSSKYHDCAILIPGLRFQLRDFGDPLCDFGRLDISIVIIGSRYHYRF